MSDLSNHIGQRVTVRYGADVNLSEEHGVLLAVRDMGDGCVQAQIHFDGDTHCWVPAARVTGEGAEVPVRPADTFEFMVVDILGMIDEDGLGDTATFADLHDFVDANEYLDQAITAAAANDPTIPTEGDAWLELCNRLADAVDAWLVHNNGGTR